MNLRRLADLLANLEGVCANLRAELERAETERDPLVTHIFRARKSLRQALNDDNKSAKKSERALIQSFGEAQALGFRGTFGEWSQLLRAGG